MEDLDKKEIKETIEEKKVVKYRSLGNFLLMVLVVLIVGTGSLIYYLIYTARGEYEQNNILNNTVEEEPDTIANIIDTVVTNATATNNTINSSDISSRKVLNEDLIVLYDGLILNTSAMEEIIPQYIDYSKDDKDKYVITYYSYENYSFIESKLGILSSQIFDGLVKIENVGKVAISENYNAIPRDVKVVNSIPTLVLENNPKISDYDTTKTLIVDLDGNGTDEYIVVLANKEAGYSKIMLVDSKGIKVADLAYIEKSKWESVATSDGYYLSINEIEIIDIDNDGIMEILIEIPKYEGISNVSLLKYKNGELSGTTDIECSLLP